MKRNTVLSLLLVTAVVVAVFSTPGVAATASITADPNDPDVTSTHSVVSVVGSDADSASLNGLKVDYQSTGQNHDVSDVGTSDIVKVGIDRGGNDSGTTIDVNVNDDLSSVEHSNNGETLKIGFGGSYSLQEGDEIVAVYDDAQNPSAGDYTIEFSVNPQSAQSISSGTLSIVADTPTPTPTPTPAETETSTPTPTETATPTPTETATETTTQTPTPTETQDETTSDGSTATPTDTPEDSSDDSSDGYDDSNDYDDGTSSDDHNGNATAANARNLTVGDNTQAITDLHVKGTEPGANGVDVYINVTSLQAANVGLDSLNVQVSEWAVHNATHIDQNVHQNNGNTTVRLRFDVADSHTAFTVDVLTLLQLDTDSAVPTDDLYHYVSVSDEERLGNDAPGVGDEPTTTYGVASDDDESKPTATATSTPTVANTEGPGSDTGGESTDEAATDTTSDEGVGFGAVLAIVVLLGAALWARRAE